MTEYPNPSDEILPNRYPGLVPFNESQNQLFCGRTIEIKELYNLISAEQLVVLFAKSGVGKSSLLHAGLFPRLREKGYFPIKIRFQNPEANQKDGVIRTPTEIMMENIRLSLPNDIVFQNDGKEPLWEFLKKLSIKVTDEDELVPTLVFDQFEEFFRYPITAQEELLRQLAEVLHNLVPVRISEALRKVELRKRTPEMIEWAKQPRVRCVIAIRDDRLSELDAVNRFIPLILKKRYKLNPLNETNAKLAMAEPAAITGRYSSVIFNFEESTLDGIIRLLAGKPGNSVEYAIDGSQLQKVCMYIEKKVINAQSQYPDGILIDNNFIDPEKEVAGILDSFYGEQLKTVGGRYDQLLCRNIIENHLISGRSRASLTDDQMQVLLAKYSSFFGKTQRDDLIEKMINARIIKEETTHLGLTYELGHETLVNSVIKYASENKLKKSDRQKVIYGVMFAISLILLFICLFFFYQMNVSSNKNNLALAKSYYQQGNDFYAFNIWDGYTHRLVRDGVESANIDSLLDHTAFFDIGTGDSAVFTTGGSVVVHERDNSINIWQSPDINAGRPRPLSPLHIPGAGGLKVSGSGRYAAYRTDKGKLYIYDAIKKDTIQISSAAMRSESSRNSLLDADKPELAPDARMNFIPGSDFLGYLTKVGLYVYNPAKSRLLPLIILPIRGEDFRSDYILTKLQVSADQQYLAIQKSDSLKVWAIGGQHVKKLRKVLKIGQLLNYFNNSKLCYTKSDSLILEDFIPGKRAKSIRLKLSSIVINSPDNRALLFYDKSRQLTLLNGCTLGIDTVIKDYQFFKKSSPISMMSSLVGRWVSDKGIRYMSKDQYPFFHRMTDSARQQILEINNVYRYGKTTWALSPNSIYAFRDNQRIYTDTLLTGLTWFDGLNTSPEVLISREGDRLAYITRDAQSNYLLKIISIETGKAVASFSGIRAAGLHFNSREIQVEDIRGRSGLYFYLAGRRDRNYYRARYAELTDAQQQALGLKAINFKLNLK